MQRIHTLERSARLLAVLMVVLAMIMPATAVAAPPAAPLAQPESGTVTGTVFRDYNANGAQDTNQLVAPFLKEPTVAGVIVTAYDSSNTVQGTTTTVRCTAASTPAAFCTGLDLGPNYSLAVTGSGPYRIEFTLPNDGSLDYLEEGATSNTAGQSTDVRFVADPGGGTTANINKGYNNPVDYSQTNPPLITAQTAYGPRNPVTVGPVEPGLPTFTLSASENANQSVISIPYTADGDLSNTNNAQRSTFATLKQTGTVYGMAYNRQLELVFAGTYFKSYADTGPIQGSGWLQNVDPLGAVYAVTPVALAGEPPNNDNARVYANLNKIKDPTSADPFIPGNPAGIDPRRTGGINYDVNDCDGPTTGAGGQASPASGLSCWRHDPVAFDKVGAIGLGDVESDDKEQTLFVVNLADKKLYQLPVEPNSANWPIQTLAAPPVAIPNNCANPADAVPGGLGFRDGQLYVGVTCTSKSTQDPDQLKAEVWRFNPQTQVFSGSPVFSVNLGYPRGCIFSGYGGNENTSGGINAPKNVLAGIETSNCQPFSGGGSPTAFDSANWNPWPANWQDLFTSNEGINSPGRPGRTDWSQIQIEHSSPWFSDITFDGNDLIMGFRDINGDHMGNAVRSPLITSNTALPVAYRVQDQFSAQLYSNNNGNVNWTNDWTEAGETTNPTADDIRIVNNVSNYQLRLQGPSNSIQRSTSSAASPTGVNSTTGTLSFAYRRAGMDAGDTVLVELSINGGAFTTIATIAGSGAGVTDPTYVTAIYEVTLGAPTVLRFSTNSSMDTTDILYLDNVEIINTRSSWMTQYTYSYTGAAFGDLLRACWNGTTWVLESNGTCGAVTTAGANNGQGPSTVGTYPGSIGSPFNGYGEFYWDDSGPGSRNANSGVTSEAFFNPTGWTNGTMYRGHEQTMMGGTFQQAGLPDIAVTIADQFGYGDGGLARFSSVINHPDITLQTNGQLLPLRTYPAVLADTDPLTGNEAGLALRHTRLYGSGAGFFAKANGLGDVEALTDPAPIEIGNYVWRDTTVNGRQDPGEGILSGVVVELWKDTNNDGIADTKVAEDTTDANGAYLFSSSTNPNNPGENWGFIADNQVLADTTYEIRILRTQTNLATPGFTVPTLANADAEQRDSDGVAIADTGGPGGRSITGVRFTTGGPGVNDHTYDFGFYDNDEVLTLGNQVWYDINNNGVLDAGEVGIDGVKVDLYADNNGDGVLTPGFDTLIATTNTAGGGLYQFTNLLPGNYVVHITQDNFGAGGPLNGMASSTGNNPTPDPDNSPDNDDNGYHLIGNGTPTYPGGVASLAVTLSANSEPGPPNNNTNPTVDFGFFGLGAIGNYVWVDENSDGYQDEGEPGIPNVQVNLYDAAGVLVATTYTDSHGGYLFDNLKPGTYYVDVLDGTGGTAYSLPFPGMTQTSPPTLPNADFGNQAHTTPIPSTGFTGYPVTIGGAQPLENLTADFGYNYNPSGDVNTPPNNPGGTPGGAAVAALGDRIWIDSDGQGDQDPNEVGVSGVTVQIFTAGPDGIFGTGDDVPGATQTTNANGYYLFDGLAPGAYVVKVVSDTGASHAILTGGQYNQTGDPDHFGVPGTGASSDTDNATTTPVLLGPGDVFLNADFGYQPTGATLGSIGDTIWFDADADGSGPALAPIDGGAPVNQGNGLQNDASEYGIPGVTVVLIKDSNGDGRWDAGEPIIATTTTNANGQYLFPGLPLTDGTGTDDYIVWVNDSNNVLGEMVPTYDKDGRLLPASPSIRTGLGISAVTNLGTTGGTPYGANDVRDQDFGYTNTYQQLNPANPAQPLGLIGDYVWFDSNRNNLQDEPGRGVEGVLVELRNATGTVVIATTVTDENGYYSFGGLPLNTSYIVSIPASNFAAGAPLEGTTNTGGPAGGSGNTGPVVNLTPANPVNLVQDFGYAAPTNAQGSIGNLVWEDLNADGVWQTGEPPIQGVTIDLYRDLNGNGTVDPGEPLMGTRTTDANGNYLFDSLPIVGGGDGDPEAEYVVDVTDVNGKLAGYWHSLSPNQDPTTNGGNDPAANSKVDPFAVEIGSGAGGQPVPNNLNVDFGYYVKPAAVGNFVWLDSNGNGIQDVGEPGIDGVTIQMRVEYPDGTIHSVYTVTGDDPSTAAVEQGWYSFGNLLQDEDYGQSSTGATPLANQPRYVIVSPPDVITVGSTTYNLTAPNQGVNDMVDSDNIPGNDETASSATQGRNTVMQDANASNESNPNAGYDFGYAIPMDLGDLPDPAYPTTVGSNGARHQLTTALKLGATVDAEYNGQPDSAATGDDNDGTANIASLPGNTGDDEDGVAQAAGVGGGWKEGTVAGNLGGALQVVISGGSGVPQVFMDFTGGGLTGLTLYYDDDNNTGTPLVQYNGTALAPNTYRFYFDIPVGACPTGGNAIETRVRLSAAGGLSATGLAPDGEVEDYIFECSSAPLAVLLATFDATAQTDHILVAWETVSEVNNAGFNLYRSLAADGERTLLTTAPSAAPGSTQGAAYSFQDADVLAGQTYWYWLEDMDLSGATTLHGPVSVAFSAPTAVTLNEVSADSAAPLTLTWLLLAAGLAAAGLTAVTLRRRTTLR